MRVASEKTMDGQGGVSLWRWLALAAALLLVPVLNPAEAPGQLARIKDVATIEGIRDNQLVGYGLVVGLSLIHI